MSAIVAQQVCTTCVCSCSTHTLVSHDCPARRVSTASSVGSAERQTHLVALAPAAVRALVAEQEIARLAQVRAVLVRLPDERERLARELRGVREADAPRADPAALEGLRFVEVVDCPLDDLPAMLCQSAGIEERGEQHTRCQQNDTWDSTA